ncbi:MAG: hypothetical protein IJ571_00825 [Ruminococcus sp.]|nr:hypothetical protein [Ruminococcus sp.]
MGIRLKPVCFAIICALIVNLTSNYASTSQEKIKLTKLDNYGKTAVQPTFDTNIYLGDDYKVEFLSTTNTSQDWFYHLTAFSEAPKTTIDPQDFIEDFTASVESHSRIMAETAETAQKFCYLYRIENDLEIFDSNGKVIGSIKKGALFTGAESDDGSGLIVIDYEYSTLTVDKENIKKLDNAVVLPTAAIGQWGEISMGYVPAVPRL